MAEQIKYRIYVGGNVYATGVSMLQECDASGRSAGPEMSLDELGHRGLLLCGMSPSVNTPNTFYYIFRVT